MIRDKNYILNIEIIYEVHLALFGNRRANIIRIRNLDPIIQSRDLPGLRSGECGQCEGILLQLQSQY